MLNNNRRTLYKANLILAMLSNNKRVNLIGDVT